MKHPHGPLDVSENYPFFSRPCHPPFGRPGLVTGPVLSIAASARSRSAPRGGNAPVVPRDVLPIACDAL